MKLRNFLYLNTKILDEYLAAIDGGVYDEESRRSVASKDDSVSGKGTLGMFSGNGEHSASNSMEIKKSVRIGDAAKFDKIYKYLSSDDEDGIKYYECMTEEIYTNLRRDEFLEVLVSVRFSKMKAFVDTMRKIADMATTMQGFIDTELIDKETEKMLKGFSALEQLQSGKEIACVCSFEDGKYPMVAYLDENYFRCSQDNFVGQSYMLCKVMRKVPKGQSVKLDEIFDDIKSIPLNREQRRNMPKNLDNPEQIRDVVKGPALVVLPIAVYQ